MMIIQAVGSFPIVHAGSEDVRARYLPRLSTGRALAAYLVSEPGAGSDVAAIRTRARRDGDGYVLDGTKVWATNGGVAELLSVLARTSTDRTRGLTFFVVERDTPGLEVVRTESKLGQRSSNTAELSLQGVRVPAWARLGDEGEGFKIAMADFDMSRPAIAAQALGIAEGALELVLDGLRGRIDAGGGLDGQGQLQALLADAGTAVETGRGLVYRAAARKDREQPNTRLASMAKLFCGDTAVRVTQDVLQALGERACVVGHPAERMYRDAKLTQIFEGTNQIQRLVVARDLVRRGLDPDREGS
jgi:cyclohexane-1-carbonyl-CoA dehydrogenase